MIFVTVGTEKFPFDRLLRILDQDVGRAEIGSDVFAQIGTSRYEPAHFPWSRFLSLDEMAERIRRADVVVSHAGIGSLLKCLEMGKTPILFPRLAAFGEQVDNHQLEFLEKMALERPLIWACDERELLDRIRDYPEIVRRPEERIASSRGGLVAHLNLVSRSPETAAGVTKDRLCLVCSSGGHCSELKALRDFWSGRDRFWVTFERDDTAGSLKGETTYYAHAPTNRNLKNLIRNAFLAWRILRKERPSCIVSTGAGVAVPFFYVGRALKIKTVFIETLSRVENLSLSGRLAYPVADVFLFQWPALPGKRRKIEFRGQVI
jgi:UDP-N-acetylglucosamine transferase subunit ALG13